MMKLSYRYTGLLLFLGSFLMLVSCSDEKNPVQQYGNTMTQSYKNVKAADIKINLEQVRRSIQEFYAANGRYPADLNEVKTVSGLTLKSDNYDYNPATGALTEKP